MKQWSSILITICAGMGGISLTTFLLTEMNLTEYLLWLFGSFFLTMYAGLLIIEAQSWVPGHSYLPQLIEKIISPWLGRFSYILYLALYYLLLAGYLGCGAALLSHALFFEDTLLTRGIVLLPWLIIAIIFLNVRHSRGVIIGLAILILLLSITLAFFSANQVSNINFMINKDILHAALIPLLFISFPFGVSLFLFKRLLHDNLQIRSAVFIGGMMILVLTIATALNIMFFKISGLWFANGIIGTQPDTQTLLLNVVGNDANNTVGILFYIVMLATLTGSFLALLYFFRVFWQEGSLKKQPLPWYQIALRSLVIPILLILFFPEYTLFYLWSAGLLIILLFVIMPAIIVWVGRYWNDVAFGYRVWGGRLALAAVILLGLGLMYLVIHSFLQ